MILGRGSKMLHCCFSEPAFRDVEELNRMCEGLKCGADSTDRRNRSICAAYARGFARMAESGISLHCS